MHSASESADFMRVAVALQVLGRGQAFFYPQDVIALRFDLSGQTRTECIVTIWPILRPDNDTLSYPQSHEDGNFLSMLQIHSCKSLLSYAPIKRFPLFWVRSYGYLYIDMSYNASSHT
ncbi:hypothetical protein LF95_10415 [Thalassospira sp. TSL5-1]|nr:hypothetical protein LF95_10415 [Thalassospira sp. TSL5-1]